jgi:hypothetical protein
MFQLLQPLGWLALGAVAVPLLIHLWRRPIPVVRVGSLRPFLAHLRPARSRWFREWPLLLLRCAILAALALAFAGLVWAPRTPTPARWCLLIPGTSLRENHLNEWQERLAQGFEPRWLAPGFPKVLDRRASPEIHVEAPVWPLLSEVDRTLAPGSEAWVFGPTWRSLFQGNRPTVSHLRVQWHAVPTPPPAVAEPSPVRAGVVHSADRMLDADSVRAALEAMGVALVTHEVPSLVFQLGAVPLPASWTEPASQLVHVIRDAPESAEILVEDRRIDVDGETFALRQRVAAGPGVPIFRDSHGDPWLTEERQGSAVLWNVAFRFHPDWTDWPLEASFPRGWRRLLEPDGRNTAPIAPEQAAPRFEPDATPGFHALPPRPPARDLRAGCWLVGASLFLIERLLTAWAGRHRTITPTASAAS